MEIITGTEEELRDMLEGVYQRRNKCKLLEDEYALTNYIIQLRQTLKLMTGNESFQIIENTKKNKKFYQYSRELIDKEKEEFIKHKVIHNYNSNQLLDITEEELSEIINTKFVENYSLMTKNEFYQYLFEFVKKYGLEKEFDKFMKSGKIFNRAYDLNDTSLGETIYDPTKRKANMVFSEFERTLPYLAAFSHEFGHVYDLKLLPKKTIKEFLEYTASSVYAEVLSSTFEKLFLDFLLEKQYCVDDTKEFISGLLSENHNLALEVCVLSLLGNKTLRDGNLNINDKKIIKQLKPNFEDVNQLKIIFGDDKLNIHRSLIYMYGDYISSIMKDTIQNEGFDNKFMREFMEERTKPFNLGFFEKNNITLDSYQKVYKKDISHLKK